MEYWYFLLSFVFAILITNADAGEEECWTSGCQPFDWAQRGCFPSDEWSITGPPMSCPGGDKYKCCKKDANEAVATGKECWTSGCQPFEWAQRGCFPDDEWEKVAEFGCSGGNTYKCCTKSKSSSSSGEPSVISRVSSRVTTARPPESFEPSEDPVSSSSSSSAEEGLSFSQFSDAVVLNGYPAPTVDQYNTLMDYAHSIGGITSIKELAMFVSHALVNSDGLRMKREDCGRDCATYASKRCDVRGQTYEGRGYMGLRYCYNYLEASEDLYGDDRLLKDPSLVERDEESAWGTGLWFWKRSVRGKPGVLDGKFGASTSRVARDECSRSIRGARGSRKAKLRFQVYTKVLVAFGQSGIEADERGCYN